MNKRQYQTPHTDIIEAGFIYMAAGTTENPDNAQSVNNVELDSNHSTFFEDEEPLVSSNIWE